MALNPLAKRDAPLSARIPKLPQIVAFRNPLIHGSAKVRAITVWNVTQRSLPALLIGVHSLLEALGAVQSLMVSELRRLHEGVLARYGLQPSELAAWKARAGKGCTLVFIAANAVCISVRGLFDRNFYTSLSCSAEKLRTLACRPHAAVHVPSPHLKFMALAFRCC